MQGSLTARVLHLGSSEIEYGGGANLAWTAPSITAKKQLSLDKDSQSKDNHEVMALSSGSHDGKKKSATHRSECEKGMLDREILLKPKQVPAAKSYVSSVDREIARQFTQQHPGMSRPQSREQYARDMSKGFNNKKPDNPKPLF
ncbi:MAG: hypothetical protein Q9217_006551 [Psora testacea]